MTELERLARRLERERRVRRDAERIAEETTRGLYDRQQELLTLEAVAAAANGAATLEDALEVAVAKLGAYTGWPVGHAWVRASSGDALRPSGIWHIDAPELHGSIATATEGWLLHAGEGLPGEVLQRGEPVWIDDVPAAELPRRPAGLASAFGVPVFADGEVVAVLEFFARLPTPPDERLLWLTEQVTTHLSHVAERLAASDRIAHQALHDALTGLPNRALFEDHLGAALARARRRSTFIAVLFLDVDRFKLVNDTLGHRVGDELLRRTAERLRGAVRAADTVARFGGDEFAICCEDLNDDRDALVVAGAIQAALAEPVSLDGEEHVLGASVGIAMARGREATVEGLLRDADSAMYRAKESGRGRYEIFDDLLRERLDARLRVERELRAGIERGELRLVYQPVLSIETGAMRCVEALVRWEHPERGLLGPGEFLPVAEESGLILRLGEFVLREACRQAACWRAEYGESAPLPVNVNLAARQLGQPTFVSTVERALADSGARATDIGLEITETAVIENTLLAIETLDRLKELGVGVLLDDFGTGYSSLSYLQRLPVDVLKIDRSFISPLGGDDARGEAIVAAIVGMARALGIEVIAEGVETSEQAMSANELGCALAQGFYYRRPMPASAVEAMLDSAG